jgi:hypothetical protein
MYAPLPAFGRWLEPGDAALRLEPIVMRCLEKQRARRFPSAGALRQALEVLRVPDKTLRLPRPSPVPIRRAPPPLRPRPERARRTPRPSMLPAREARPTLRYASLLQWAIVGCCLGAFGLWLVHWLGAGHG